MKKNICLTTWYNSINYGTCIQCYALAEYLRKNNFNVIIPDTYKYYYGLSHPIETAKKICDKITIKKSEPNNENKINLSDRVRKNALFAQNKTKITTINNRKEYNTLIKKCEYFISGSDQIWNPMHVTPPMLLSMAGKRTTKIAYGSSFGVSEIPTSMKRFYKKYLKRYNYIGVRELTGKKIISDLINREANVVLDPSFLLDKNDWERVAKKPKCISSDRKDFVFLYFIGENLNREIEIQKFLQREKLPMYYALGESKKLLPYGEAIIDMGVEEFIWCILNAKYIITDSFHGIALSINFNKNFYVYRRFSDNDIHSQNSRIYDLINTFGLTCRIESLENNLNCIKKKIDYKKINNKLGVLRDESKKFLFTALGEENE